MASSQDASERKLGAEILVKIEEIEDDFAVIFGTLRYGDIGQPNSIHEIGPTEDMVALLGLAKEMARKSNRRIVVQLFRVTQWAPTWGKLSPLKSPEGADYLLCEVEPNTVPDAPLEELTEIMEGLDNVVALLASVSETKQGTPSVQPLFDDHEH